MTREQIAQRIEALKQSREKAQREADMSLSYTFGVIDGQIALLEALLETETGETVEDEAA